MLPRRICGILPSIKLPKSRTVFKSMTSSPSLPKYQKLSRSFYNFTIIPKRLASPSPQNFSLTLTKDDGIWHHGGHLFSFKTVKFEYTLCPRFDLWFSTLNFYCFYFGDTLGQNASFKWFGVFAVKKLIFFVWHTTSFLY